MKKVSFENPVSCKDGGVEYNYQPVEDFDSVMDEIVELILKAQ